MNSLNSVLIEGDVNYIVRFEGETLFCIEAHRDGHDPLMINVRALGRLGQACAETLKIGRGVRVVGRLEAGEAGLRVYAEHVEFKPAQKRPQPVNHSANSDAEYMGDHDSGL